MIDHNLQIMEAQSFIEPENVQMHDKETWHVNMDFVNQFETFQSFRKATGYIESYFREKNSPTDFTNDLLAIL